LRRKSGRRAVCGRFPPRNRYFSLTAIELTIFASPPAWDATELATASCKSLATLPYKYTTRLSVATCS
jgi:hypothetical protein